VLFLELIDHGHKPRAAAKLAAYGAVVITLPRIADG
jgi:hypothetical protein